MARSYPACPSEVKFDRAEMQNLVASYWEAIMAIKPETAEEDKTKVGAFLTDDFVSREADWPQIRIKEGWLNFLAYGYPQYIFKIYYKKPEGYICADNRTGMVVSHVREEIIQRSTGKVVKSCMNNIHMHLVNTPDGLKIDREAVSRIPALFQVDQLKTGEGVPHFMWDTSELT